MSYSNIFRVSRNIKMPRTKSTRKSKQEQVSVEECDLLVRDFELRAQLRISKMEQDAKMAIKSLENYIDITLSRLPAEIRQMTLGELLLVESDNDKENLNAVSTSAECSSQLPETKGKKQKKRITTASDDGYATEGVTTASRPSRTTKRALEPPTTRRTRSTSKTGSGKLSEIHQGTVKKAAGSKRAKESLTIDKFKTPASLRPSSNTYGPVTPKIKPNTPVNVLRRPRQGEMVLSMQGSPILASAIIQESMANINVPLRNGNLISLLPNAGLRMSTIPALDAETIQQLETLKSHIEKVISLK